MAIKYSQKVVDHFLHPKNQGKIKNPDGIGKVGNISCGDVMYFYIKVDNGTIIDVRWETMGCAAAIAVSSIVSEMIKGKKIEEVLKLTNKDVLKELGDLPPLKIHCSLLGIDALDEAIYNYMSKNNLPIPKDLEEKHKKEKEILEKIEG